MEKIRENCGKKYTKEYEKKIKKIKNFWKKVGQILYLQKWGPHPYFIGVCCYNTLIFSDLYIHLRFTDFGKIDRFAHKTC